MAGDMRQLDVAVMAHPSVPVAAADACGLDLDNNPMDFGCWIIDGDKFRGFLELLEQDGFHLVSNFCQWFRLNLV